VGVVLGWQQEEKTVLERRLSKKTKQEYQEEMDDKYGKNRYTRGSQRPGTHICKKEDREETTRKGTSLRQG